MVFNCNIKEYEHELRDILRMFVPFFALPTDACFDFFRMGDKGECEVKIGEKTYKYSFLSGGLTEKQLKKELKKRLYLALEDFLGISLPWGSLTGIRPSKIAYNFLSQGGCADGVADFLQKEYYVSQKKAGLTAEIVKNQAEFLQKLFFDGGADKSNSLSDCVNLYIHIPFCPTRCSYCSFVSLPQEKNEALLADYLRLLRRDIIQTISLIKKQNKKILSVYIGGGTPTVLDGEQLDSLLGAVDADELTGKAEFTVEAGRPDTITAEKLEALKRHNVTRICVNPQSFNDKTLKAIGRSHSSRDIFAAFDLSRRYGFDVNMDLIAGLPSESLKDFEYSLNSAVFLRPENITVHTLSLKRGSKMNERLITSGESPFKTDENIESMTDLAHNTLESAGYLPYYLYRQKDAAQSLENTGFCLKNKQSVNNITVMEETVPVYACGAGAISKRISCKTITRLAELRDVGLYIKEFEDRLAKKLEFLN